MLVFSFSTVELGASFWIAQSCNPSKRRLELVYEKLKIPLFRTYHVAVATENSCCKKVLTVPSLKKIRKPIQPSPTWLKYKSTRPFANGRLSGPLMFLGLDLLS